MGRQWRFTSDSPSQNAKVRVANRATRQGGRITFAQLRSIGVGAATVHDWTRLGYLHPRLRGVYAVGHPGRTKESDLWEAVLYAGPGAMLSHGTAARWRGLIDFAVRPIHVSTPRRKHSPPGIAVHGRRSLDRQQHKGMPVTSIVQTVIDLAATGEMNLVRKVLAQLDFRDELDCRVLWESCGYGRAGSRELRWAIAHHDPRFAQTNGPLEADWLLLCEVLEIPKPDALNVEIEGILCDAVYEDAMVIVELDGIGNHHSAAQVRRDRRNDKTLRDAGWLVLRYTSEQLKDDPEGVRDEIIRELTQRAGRARAV